MSKERLSILKMLEEGKITSAEALHLLQALDDSESNDGNKDNLDLNFDFSKSIQNTIDELNKRTEIISRRLSLKIDDITKELEANLKLNPEKISDSLKAFGDDFKTSLDKVSSEISKNSAELSSKISGEASQFTRTSESPDMLSENIRNLQGYFYNTSINIPGLGDKLSSIFKNLTPQDTNSKVYSAVYRKSVSDTSVMKLVFESINGDICVEVYDENEIEIELYCKTSEKNIDRIISIIDTNDTYGARVNGLSSTSVSFNIKIPKKIFKRIYSSTSNGKIDMSDVSCKNLICITPKGRISISGVKSDIIECTTSYSRIEFFDIICQRLFAKTSNSPVSADNINCSYCDIKTTNGRIVLELSDELSTESEIGLSTDNSSIDIVIPQTPDTGAYIDASVDNGSVSINIPDILYSIKEHKTTGMSHVTCSTDGYDSVKNHIKITAQTTNSNITVK